MGKKRQQSAPKDSKATKAAQDVTPAASNGEVVASAQPESSPAPTVQDPPADRAPKLAKAKLPRAIKLRSFFSFYDEDGQHRQWAPHTEINDPEHVAELVGRKVEHDVVE